MKRAAAPALALGLTLSVFAVPAAAQEPPGSTVVRYGGYVALNARDGAANSVRVGVTPGGRLIVEDDSGISAGPGCTPLDGTDGTAADCGNATTVTRLAVNLRDQGDSLFVSAPVNTSVDAGTGPDFIRTNGGNDTINLRDGVNGNDSADCDGGSGDTAQGNPGDFIATNCERRATF